MPPLEGLDLGLAAPEARVNSGLSLILRHRSSLLRGPLPCHVPLGLCLKRARRSEAVERARAAFDWLTKGAPTPFHARQCRPKEDRVAPAARKRSNRRPPLGSGRTGVGARKRSLRSLRSVEMTWVTAICVSLPLSAMLHKKRLAKIRKAIAALPAPLSFRCLILTPYASCLHCRNRPLRPRTRCHQ